MSAPMADARVTYDFSKWELEELDPSDAVDASDASDASEAEDEADAAPVTFRVYTPEDIKSKTFLKTPSSFPAPEVGIRDMDDALRAAEALGPRALVTRMIFGGAAAAIALAAILGVVRLADDTGDGDADGARARVGLATDLPPAAPASFTSYAPEPTYAPAPAPPQAAHVYSTYADDDPPYIELPAAAKPAHRVATRAAASAPSASSAPKSHGTIVRANPY